MMIQLNPMLPVKTPKGPGYAFLILDYSQEHDLYFTCALDNGELWTWSNKEIRMQNNITLGRINSFQGGK